MLVIKNFFCLLICLLNICVINNAYAINTVVPEQLIALDTSKGKEIFYNSEAKQAYWPLSIEFVTQENLTYCAIASSVMVLNALNIEAPKATVYKPYRTFTQDNFFTPAVRRFITPEHVKRYGATLAQIGHAMATFPVKLQVVYANETTLTEFRELARKVVGNKSEYIIVNFARKGLNEVGAGHMSPLAAYDKATDRFLLMDVARYKYPPVWVTTSQLWSAMHTIDFDAKAYRGFVIISKK